MPQSAIYTGEALTERQKDVLNAALQLLVEGNDAPTMADIARRASCSKESIYKWFGDRDRFWQAMVQWQASQVRLVPLKREAVDTVSLFASLEHFARDWLRVLSSTTSIVLNRLAVSHAGFEKSRLGTIVLHNGPVAMARRLKPVLELGREAGLLAFDDTDAAFRTFFGLVVRDMQIRLLLGDDCTLQDNDINREAYVATQQFFTLYSRGGDEKPAGRKRCLVEINAK